MAYKNPAHFTPEDIRVNQAHIQSMPCLLTKWGAPVWQVRDRDANPTPPPNRWQRFMLRWFL